MCIFRESQNMSGYSLARGQLIQAAPLQDFFSCFSPLPGGCPGSSIFQLVLCMRSSAGPQQYQQSEDLKIYLAIVCFYIHMWWKKGLQRSKNKILGHYFLYHPFLSVSAVQYIKYRKKMFFEFDNFILAEHTHCLTTYMLNMGKLPITCMLSTCAVSHAQCTHSHISKTRQQLRINSLDS